MVVDDITVVKAFIVSEEMENSVQRGQWGVSERSGLWSKRKQYSLLHKPLQTSVKDVSPRDTSRFLLLVERVKHRERIL